MTRLTFVLLGMAIASALYLVHTQYESRRLYVELEKAHAQANKLDMETQALQIEKRSQATPLRVEKLAKDRLQMRTATPAITEYISQRNASTAGAKP